MSTPTTIAPLTGTWTIDPVHSSASFSVKHLVSKFRGGFATIEGAYDADAGVLRGAVPVESVEVKLDDLRAHLLSPEFFDAANHPTITFTSTDVDVAGDRITVTGDLTMHGVTRAVTGTGEISEPIPGPAGNVIAISLETTVDRNEFGLTWNMEAPGGRKVLGDHVTLVLDLELGQAA